MQKKYQKYRWFVVITLSTAFLLEAGPALADWPQQQKLTASDAADYDYFGYSVSIDGEYAIVGARYDDDRALNAGSAYIFKRIGESWIEQDEVTASDGASSDLFGFSVSISGDYAIIGAPSHNSQTGAAYIFKRSGTSWSQQAKLTAFDGLAGDNFGFSVSISGDYAIVGAYFDDDPFHGNDCGSAYIFEKPHSGWADTNDSQKIFSLLPMSGERFGCSVSIDANNAVVGADHSSDSPTLTHIGAAYLFEHIGLTWGIMYKFTASDASAGDWFGASVAIRGDKIIIGATGKDLPAKGQVGGAYIYDRLTLIEQANLMASDPDASDYFGVSVSISGDYAIVGAYGDSEGGDSAGAAYIIRWDGSNWTELEKLIATGSADYESFGCSVSMDGDYAIVGSYGDDNRGSAFVYNHICPTADLDDDCRIDYYDLDTFTDFWLETGCGDIIDCNGADLSGNGDVNFVDYATFASQWRQYN